VPARWKDFKAMQYTLQVAPEDCTGCALCVEVCPAKSKSEVKHKAINMAAQAPLREPEAANWDFFLKIPEIDRRLLSQSLVKDSSVAAAAVRILRRLRGMRRNALHQADDQLFGDRAIIGNATGCSSIYGGNLPTTPYTVNNEGLGPAWSNSLFEDNAEFGLGMRLAIDKQKEYAGELVARLGAVIGDDFAQELLDADQSTEAGIFEQRARVKRS
jgi:pyruvate-ferredoxin/flavodoxin oxidoreductase